MGKIYGPEIQQFAPGKLSIREIRKTVYPDERMTEMEIICDDDTQSDEARQIGEGRRTFKFRSGPDGLMKEWLGGPDKEL